ncbi:MAG: hypothetical protein ACQEXJ_10640 [Myxococcota bacterium]
MAPDDDPYDVRPYSIGFLVEFMAGFVGADSAVVRQRTHLTYFEEYFEYLGAQTVVVERDYVDRDYLEDFAAYYVRCFHRYPRSCARLHFFREEFDVHEFESWLGEARAELPRKLGGASYLGFIVVKPLPETIMGRTCLRSYGDTSERRYPVTVKYPVSFFGWDLAVESLAFQEQDHVAAACATSALWSAFHATGRTFPHLEWDIRLTTVQAFKRKLRQEGALARATHRRLMISSWPRFLWHVRGWRTPEQPTVDFLFDATDIEQGSMLIDSIVYETWLPRLAGTMKPVGAEVPGFLRRGQQLLEDLEKHTV